MTFNATLHAKAMQQALALDVQPEWEPSVAANLALIEAAARVVMAFPLPDEVESALVFKVP